MNDFYETIFLKSNSSLEKKLQLLKANPRADKNDIHMLEMGIAGEKQVEYHLNKANIGMYVLHDLNIECENMKAQIDFVVVTNHHCYFVECKNYNSDVIHVDENGNFEIGSGRNKKGIKSPLSQVEDQMTVFKRIFLKEKETTDSLINGIVFDNYFKSVVVFTNAENRLNIKKAPNDIKYRILKVDNLIRQIEYDRKHHFGPIMSKDQMEAIATYIYKKNVDVNIVNVQGNVEAVRNKVMVMDNSHANVSNTNFYKELFIALGCIMTFFLMIAFVGFSSAYYKGKTPSHNSNYYNNSNSNSNSNVNNNTNNSNKKIYLTNNQIKAINILRSGYNNSLRDGFEVIHASVCSEMNALFDNKISCYMFPALLNFVDNKITIYENFSCFTLILSDDGKQLISKKADIYTFNKNNDCSGTPIGFSDWDPDNEYFKKIGGYEKIKELAMYTRTNNKALSLNDYLTYDHIAERGGNPGYAVSYNMDVNKYFKGLTGHSGYGMSMYASRENTNKMCESYYYIMK